MSALAKTHLMTPEAYLEMERTSQTKHEYLNGEIFAMAGASRNHIKITGNTLVALHPQVLKRSCEIYQTDMRVKISASGHYTYPDLVVVCGEAQFEDEQVDTLLNPTLIIEVLSPSTESYDRGAKFQSYRSLDSLQEYLLISQSNVRVEHYSRRGQQWILSDAADLDDVIELPSIGAALPLREIYLQIQFSPE